MLRQVLVLALAAQIFVQALPLYAQLLQHDEETSFLQQQPDLASRNGKELTLRLPSGNRLTLHDKDEGDCEREIEQERAEGKPERFVGPCVIHHRVVAFWSEHRLFLIDLLFYEGSAAALVNENGTSVWLAGRPIFAPGKSRFVAFWDDCFHFSTTTFQLWELRNGQPTKIFEAEHDETGFSDVQWDGDTIVQFNTFECNGGGPERRRWMSELRETPSGWVWQDHGKPAR